MVQPLASWKDMIDGTLTLEDVAQMHQVLDALQDQADEARDG